MKPALLRGFSYIATSYVNALQSRTQACAATVKPESIDTRLADNSFMVVIWMSVCAIV
ncbi:hypothetical protein [Gleimia europaea]|uniref:hypothetical protein n=1 Tax=Gleimia europaea TaxID=66228 RepID=UPI000399FD05|nr:hypothetical protein [Gleimia europaea]